MNFYLTNRVFLAKQKLVRLAKLITVSSLLLITLSGCVTAIVAGVAIATVDIIHDRRTVGEYIDDNAVELTARNIIASKSEFRKSAHIKPQSWNGILLITGEIDTPEIKQPILDKFRAIQGVRQVVDETTITDKTRIGTRANDAWITSKVKSRLILKTGLDANRVKVVTTRGSVYLMGIVTREEADKATEYASRVRGVQRVVRVFEYKEPS
ncbi:division/outer membrane stress-associated lipid-binding lipoprotein [Arenicella sp. 4NH20-0111]|uniref:BON domain-containing protein n=1 Tax=Arenicella sp. 4NH20-0111 TaxID=3127648 RepID=UPI003102B153